jgi:hypothetical protein
VNCPEMNFIKSASLLERKNRLAGLMLHHKVFFYLTFEIITKIYSNTTKKLINTSKSCSF